MTKQITIGELEQIMGGITGSSLVGFDSVTIPVLTGGKKNPMQGRIRKHTTQTIFLGEAPKYLPMVLRKAEKAFRNQYENVYNVKARPFDVQGLWKGNGEQFGGALVRHKISLDRYVKTWGMENSHPKSCYTLDGEPIEKGQIEGLNASEPTIKVVTVDAEMEDGTKFTAIVEVPMIPRVYKLASVTGFRINHESYAVSDSTGQTVEVDAALVAATVQELNSPEINANHPENRQ